MLLFSGCELLPAPKRVVTIQTRRRWYSTAKRKVVFPGTVKIAETVAARVNTSGLRVAQAFHPAPAAGRDLEMWAPLVPSPQRVQKLTPHQQHLAPVLAPLRMRTLIQSA